ncbi:MAG: hypothetical protein B7Z40_16580 [Bosea sp. 12-68-7]|nr:MAG: hypothetical protein B7Z40_16580 [Bosea sp. 12-68-7]
MGDADRALAVADRRGLSLNRLHPPAAPSRHRTSCPSRSEPGLWSDPFLVIARIEVRPDAWETFVAAATCIEATRRESGCLADEIHESLTRPYRFVSFESSETRADIDRHRGSPHMRALLDAARACVTAPPVIEVSEPRSIDRL